MNEFKQRVDKWNYKGGRGGDKSQDYRPSKAKERQNGMRGGRKEEEKTTATELCRGFNQPNYSLITGTPNLEQLTHTNTYTHTKTSTHTHVQQLTASLW